MQYWARLFIQAMFVQAMYLLASLENRLLQHVEV